MAASRSQSQARIVAAAYLSVGELKARLMRVAAGSGASLGEGAIGPRERVAIDLARSLVRSPDIAVVAILLDERKPEDFRERLERLRAAREGRAATRSRADVRRMRATGPRARSQSGRRASTRTRRRSGP